VLLRQDELFHGELHLGLREPVELKVPRVLAEVEQGEPIIVNQVLAGCLLLGWAGQKKN